ncbi:protein kinase family protein [Pediococcus acidilactici]|uniref:protein kinase family protein n=1 Tax=Pediococcus acidilactici TaxID=1254 RepID=UPI001324ED7D|nr:protein kinase family protein [Pediococcus acidilactici]KAF0333138.1 protein kinase [Pediococcus acidilactici]KAF0346902.1 protein kinase [Pediococcus acidilactici]KAF0392216.1 protein kinase [Pediococcus acidilactici]KAF0395573.1 protein kinase [Pediococcus acidilactici]KAF0408211.1 protein kinase [Pediococcus acidilactici]
MDDNQDWIMTIYEELKNEKSINEGYVKVYELFKNDELDIILSSIHALFVTQLRTLNAYLPTRDFSKHFHASESRDFISVLDKIHQIEENSKGHSIEITLTQKWSNAVKQFDSFMMKSGGSEIPSNTPKMELPLTTPIFESKDIISLQRGNHTKSGRLRQIGEGSYAITYKYKDPEYGKFFVLKRAKKELNEKERQRFKNEFKFLSSCNSPYIVKVYKLTETANILECTMEYLEYDLYHFIKKHPNLPKRTRYSICKQFIRSIEYVHSKGQLHRDISLCNVLLKKYEGIVVAKLSDFGLSKSTSYSTLTSIDGSIKGSININDPDLKRVGFSNYSLKHEIYAMTCLIYFVMMGRENISNRKGINSTIEDFIDAGTNPDINKRIENVAQLKDRFYSVKW